MGPIYRRKECSESPLVGSVVKRRLQKTGDKAFFGFVTVRKPGGDSLLAFESGGGADYGFASAVSLMVFIIVAGISAFSFRFTKRLEEIYGGL